MFVLISKEFVPVGMGRLCENDSLEIQIVWFLNKSNIFISRYIQYVVMLHKKQVTNHKCSKLH